MKVEHFTEQKNGESTTAALLLTKNRQDTSIYTYVRVSYLWHI
jgi:hypothetical protein